MLKIYNTLSRDKQIFIPIEPKKVRMYVCGMTVYDFCHLGHARVMVVFDMVTRWLRNSEYEVTYVRNITDIDDKIISRANENKETIAELTQRFITAMDEDSAKLGIIRPSIEPRATAHIDGMIKMIAALIEKGHAYVAANGDVFYSVRSFNDYGKLSGKSLEDLRAGERVEIDTFKKDPLDFVLWKSVKPNEPNWDSPFGGPNAGKGRPGWHIECSVMSAEHLGAHFDIHGGGQDLQFPHHENEIAQSEAMYSVAKEGEATFSVAKEGEATLSVAKNSEAIQNESQTGEATHRCKMANYWMHNGFVRVDDEKMSKSLGNFFTIREVLEKYDAEVIRFFILRAHYRSPLNYSDHHLDDAKSALRRLYTSLVLCGFPVAESPVDWTHPQAIKFKAAMDDDFNTPEAMAVLFDLANELNKTKFAETASLLKSLGKVLGLLEREPSAFLQGEEIQLNVGQMSDQVIKDTTGSITHNHSKSEIDDLIMLRAEAKKSKNFAEADRIRKELADAGIILEDTPQGTTWRRA